MPHLSGNTWGRSPTTRSVSVPTIHAFRETFADGGLSGHGKMFGQNRKTPRQRRVGMTLRHTAALALVGWYLMVLPLAARADEVLKSCQAYAEIAKDTAIGRDRGDPLANWIRAFDKQVPDDKDGHIQRSFVQLVERIYEGSAPPDTTYDKVLGDCLQGATRNAATQTDGSRLKEK
jgi:hypothetical protein